MGFYVLGRVFLSDRDSINYIFVCKHGILEPVDNTGDKVDIRQAIIWVWLIANRKVMEHPHHGGGGGGGGADDCVVVGAMV